MRSHLYNTSAPNHNDHMNPLRRFVIVLLTILCVGFVLPTQMVAQANVVSGELRKWHKVTVTFDGPQASETGTPNPFLDYRLQVTFTAPSGKQITVPGYYAADGNASETSATSGNKWRVHLAPDETGTWTYVASFRQGSNVAVNESPTAGTATAFDGATGNFTISQTNKTGRDLRSKGRLQYVGKHHLQFAETGEFFLKGGADAPENFLAYADFDGTHTNDGISDNFIKTWSPHVTDWQNGDPSWQNGKGKGMIGAVNYLSSKGANVFSFLTMNINGDDKNVFPYTNYDERVRFDVSKLDQWQIVMEHGTKKGMYLHFKTQETENGTLLDGGNLGTQRKLYYRELIARFSHNLALNWNLGEEMVNSTEQIRDFAQYFYTNDPYRHHIVMHTYPNHYYRYDSLVGNQSRLTGASIQTWYNEVFGRTLEWRNKSAAADKPWVVTNDEQGDSGCGVPHDTHVPGGYCNYDKHDIRKQTLWGNLMAGGAGVEYYFGYSLPNSDLTAEDFRSRNDSWEYVSHALYFFNRYLPFWEMNPMTNSSSSTSWVLGKEGEIYAVYLRNGGSTTLTLPTGNYSVRWYNPRSGGDLLSGSVTSLSGSGSIGNPPSDSSSDWVALISTGNLPVSPSPVATLTPASTATNVPTQPPQLCQADINQDYTVDLLDYSMLVNNFFKTNPNPARADINTDGVVDLTDYSLLSNAFLKTDCGVSSTSTPAITPPSSGMFIDTVILVNADDNADVAQVDTSQTLTINRSQMPTFTFRAEPNTTVGSVVFNYPGGGITENVAPYAAAGDSAGDYTPLNLGVGTYTMTITPYTGSGGGGTAGTPTTFTFVIQ